MRVSLFILLFFILYSCERNKIIEEKRYVYKITSEGLLNRHSLSLIIKNKDSVIDYKYIANDSLKNLGIRYYLNKDILVLNEVFYYTNKKVFVKEKEYKIYGSQVNGFASHPSFILFGKDYGIKANVAYGADFLFLKDSIPKIDNELLFEKIISRINE